MNKQKLPSIKDFFNIAEVSAHCDIPCKIYDPSAALIPALSVVRLMDIMAEKSESQNTVARCILRKEEEAEKVKHEIRIIWGDYFKEPQFAKFPETHQLAHSIMLKASACKQEANRQDALDLVELVNKFAEIFWASKDIQTERKTCPYPPSLEVVYPIL